MKTVRGTRAATSSSLAILAVSGLAACTMPPSTDDDTEGRTATVSSGLSDRTFIIRMLGNRCVDVGGSAGWAEHARVRIAACKKVISQRIRVREIDQASHDVALMVPNSPFCLGIGQAPGKAIGVAVGAPLELQTCNPALAVQRFAFDGDALLVGLQQDNQRVSRELVIEPDGDVTNVGTGLGVGTRDVSDAEYFTMIAADASGAKPTSGFITAADGAQLHAALLLYGWGSVIEVTRSLTLISETHVLREGATLRAARGFAITVPEIHYDYAKSTPTDRAAIGVNDHTRVTGLRLRGPTGADADGADAISGIVASSDGFTFADVLVDHMDISNWTGAGVNVLGGLRLSGPGCKFDDWYRRVPTVRILRNFIHNNVGGTGYGVSVGWGGFPLVRGNVMYYNRHSVTASAEGTNGYVAADNFLLSTSRESGGGYDSNSDFDSHGNPLDTEGHFTCEDFGPDDPFCAAGDIFDMGWNTFLSTKHHNFKQRGTPCRGSSFHDNVSVQSQGALVTYSQPPTTLVVSNNQWFAPEPTKMLGVGDFDGDGIEDVFVGTGATWWYSPGGRREWRLLNRMPEVANELRFGDFDGDGRTDILAIHAGGGMDISWAGVSPWTFVGKSGATSAADVGVGDFDGDGLADVFLADGLSWSYAAGARTWNVIASSDVRMPDLRLGDFTADGKTDVLFTFRGAGRLVRAPGALPEAWGPPSGLALNGVVVGDFDGDGAADLAKNLGNLFADAWLWSRSGRAEFTVRKTLGSGAAFPIARLPIGRFDGNKTSDVIVMKDIDLWISRGAQADFEQVSIDQHMR